MSDLPHKSERVSGLEVWAFALATALVALMRSALSRMFTGKGESI